MSLNRLYDDKRRKRLLFITVTSWRGISIGAKHFYAKVREDDNPIVDKKGRETYSSEDREGHGREFGGMMETESSFSSYSAAIDWIVEIIKEHFPKHKIWDCSGLVTVKEIKQALKDGVD